MIVVFVFLPYNKSMKKHRYQHEFYTSKATLLIRHIHQLYTMEERHGKPIIYEDAFIAVHHDFIMALGRGQGRKYCDKDTKIIDAYGCCVVPGFIDAQYHFLKAETIIKYRDHDLLMRCRQHLCAMEAGGVTGIGLPAYADETINARMMRVYESMSQLREMTLVPYKSPINSDSIISVGTDADINDLFLMAKMEMRTQNYSEFEVLKRITVNPAKQLGLDDLRGKLAVDYQADFVVLQAPSLQLAFASLAPSCVSQVYRDGISIWKGRLHN